MKWCFAVLIAGSWCLCSCGTSKPAEATKEEKKSPDQGPKLVGRVATVPADKRFVLIQRYGKWEVESGQILTTRGPEERTANLKVTGEKLGEFAAADLQSGIVAVGDAVYSQPAVEPPIVLTAPEVSHGQSDAPAEKVQKNN